MYLLRIRIFFQLKVLVSVVMLCLLQPALAQGTSFVKKYADDESRYVDPGKTVIGPGTGSGSSSTSAETDSLSENAQAPAPKIKIGGKTPPALKPAVEKQSKKTDVDEAGAESILSFNFLYYLIQKYKMEDIIN